MQVDGEDEGTQIQETDIVTCSAKVILSRPSHTATGTAAPSCPTDVALACHEAYPASPSFAVVMSYADMLLPTCLFLTMCQLC